MDVAKLYSLIGKLTDQQLGQEMSKPSGMAPLYMVMAEMDRRARMRKGSQQQPQAYADGGSVSYDEILDELWPGLISQESRGNQSAVSPKGAFGRAQLMPDTALEVATQLGDPTLAQRARTDAAVNERLGRTYLANQLRAFGGNRALALAAYNAGPGRARQWERRFGRPEAGQEAAWAARLPIRETREYIPGVMRRAGAAVPPPPQPPNPNPLDPQALGQNSDFAFDGITRRLGMDGKPPSFDGAYEQVAARNPDVLTPAYAQLLEQLQSQRSQYDRSNRGRPLMEMGLAMMNARGPNFFQALGQGGQAGLAARDRVQAGQRDIMGQLMQAQLGSAQAQAQRNQALTGAASSMYGQQFGGLAQAMGMANSQAAQMAQIAQGNRQAEMEARRLDQYARDAEADRKLKREELEAANTERRAGQSAYDYGRGTIRRGMDSAYYQDQIRMRAADEYDRATKDKRNLTPEQKAKYQLEAEAAARQWFYGRFGIKPPAAEERARSAYVDAFGGAAGAGVARPAAQPGETPGTVTTDDGIVITPQ